jgi:tRNA-Thr(GGU) m(6)t(6)A37 methyltransferase TsaA
MTGTTPASQSITLTPIGRIHSPHQRAEETPIQPAYARGIHGKAEVWAEYADGLRDLEGFSHVCLLYWFHQAGPPRLLVTPYLDDCPRGVFATRAPCRPNPIGSSVVRLVRREGNMLHLEDVDILDGTPLLDIKPYVPRFSHVEEVRCGWLERVDQKTAAARGRRMSDRRTGNP